MNNWKTALLGAIGAGFIVIQPMIANGVAMPDWKTLVTAFLVAAFGFVAKDFNVTGGDTPAK